MRENVDNAGFGIFVIMLQRSSNNLTQTQTLVERWWDTNNTFHFLFGEMTPLDFSMITGLEFGGRLLRRLENIGDQPELVVELLGTRPNDYLAIAKLFVDTF